MSKLKDKNTIIYSILATTAFFYCIVLFGIVSKRCYSLGYIRDQIPSLPIPSYVSLDWLVMGLCVLILIICFVFWIVKKKIAVPIVALVLLIAMSLVWNWSYTSFEAYLVKNHATSDLSMGGPMGFYPISLYEFEELFNLKDKEADVPLYIGRLDCKDCESFEKAIAPFLESKELGFAMYNTSSDRDCPNSKAMYEFLEKKEIASVPLYIVIQDGKIIKRWDEPEKDIKEIEVYLTEHLKEELN